MDDATDKATIEFNGCGCGVVSPGLSFDCNDKRGVYGRNGKDQGILRGLKSPIATKESDEKGRIKIREIGRKLDRDVVEIVVGDLHRVNLASLPMVEREDEENVLYHHPKKCEG